MKTPVITREYLATLPSEEIKKHLDSKTLADLDVIESVFETRLGHIIGQDGLNVSRSPLGPLELSLLYEEPFRFDPKLEEEGFDEYVQKHLWSLADPVTWAREHLKWHLRPYQIIGLRHPRKRKVLRWGRRAGKSNLLAIKALHYCYTNRNGRVLGIMPMKLQAEAIFEEIKKLISRSEELTAEVERMAMQPAYVIEFKNGSTIKLLTAGIRSGGKSDGARGQEADVLIFDELDLLARADIEAAYVLLQRTDYTKPEKEMWAASTPTGKKDLFYEWCNSERMFSLWMPSYVNPHWSTETEAEFRDRYTDMAYRHEVEADWGEAEDGVYPRRFIERASNNDYEYIDRQQKKGIYIIGADFDKYGAGSNIIVIRLCDEKDGPHQGKVKVVWREEIPKSEFTLTHAVNRIAALNQRFLPTWIYLDRGYGEKQVEDLHRIGMEDPPSGLRQKVRGIIFSEAIETRDPATHEMVKKQVKPFMVDNLRWLLEQDRLVFPKSDEELYLQLLHYVVSRTSNYGVPVFGSSLGRDHAHDALALSCLAFILEYGDFAQQFPRPHAVPFAGQELIGLHDVPDDKREEGLLVEKLKEQYGDDKPLPIKRNRTFGGRRRRDMGGGLTRKRF